MNEFSPEMRGLGDVAARVAEVLGPRALTQADCLRRTDA